MSRAIPLLLFLFVMSCTPKEQNTLVQKADDQAQNLTELRYATGFSVTYGDHYKWVEVSTPYPEAEKGIQYLLVEKGTEIPPHDDDVHVIETPIDQIVCTSTTHIPLLVYLGETDALTGFPTTDYISSTAMRERIDAGHVTDLGVDNAMNLELLTSLNPDLVMAYTLSGDLGQFRQIQAAGIPVIINAEYLEQHPLGRAEWVKFMALFFNKEKEAESIFTKIETNYLSLLKQAGEATGRPSVLSGIVYGDTWYMPGGQNYASKLIHDAAGRYLWAEDSSSGFLGLSFEAVYEKAYEADFWIGVGSYRSLEDMKNSDTRYADFAAFKKGHVYTYDARKGAKGGSEFLELGYLRPDLILEDLIRILHPDVLKNDELFFHAPLR